MRFDREQPCSNSKNRTCQTIRQNNSNSAISDLQMIFSLRNDWLLRQIVFLWRSSMYSKKGSKSWLPEYPASAGPSAAREHREAEPDKAGNIRVKKCHKEPRQKGDQNGLNGWGPSRTQPSSCSATCRQCRDIPPSLFTQEGPNEYILYENHHQLSNSANSGCCLCWFWVQHLRRVLSILRSFDHQNDHLEEDSTGELVIRLRRPEATPAPRWILLSCGKLETRVLWSLAENGGR